MRVHVALLLLATATPSMAQTRSPIYDAGTDTDYNALLIIGFVVVLVWGLWSLCYRFFRCGDDRDRRRSNRAATSPTDRPVLMAVAVPIPEPDEPSPAFGATPLAIPVSSAPATIVSPSLAPPTDWIVELVSEYADAYTRVTSSPRRAEV